MPEQHNILNITEEKKWKKIFFWFWIYTLVVILWGAWVRISHSGDGCGDHWPKCQGEFIPDFTEKKTIVEYLHRITSGAYGVFVLWIFWQLKKYKIPRLQKLNIAFLILMISEALLGALLVKLKLVSINDSFLRLVFMSLHQLNSFMLTGVTFSLYLFFSGFKKIKLNHLQIIFLVVGVTGAIASLSTTLFPSISLLSGIIDDFSHDSHLFIKLRILHPLLALTLMLGLTSYLWIKGQTRLAGEIFIAVTIGIITLISLSPIWLKVTHLFIAHALWARFIKSAHSIQVDDVKNESVHLKN